MVNVIDWEFGDNLFVERLVEGAVLPRYMKQGDAAFDVAPHFDKGQAIAGYGPNNTAKTFVAENSILGNFIDLPPNHRVMLPTGLRFAIRPGYELQGRGRSSALKHTLRLCNGVCTIDSGYRGELFLPIENIGTETAIVLSDGRLIQFKYARAEQASIVVLAQGEHLEDFLDETERGSGSFGSTGS